jgi:site-specific recombinase XerD
MTDQRLLDDPSSDEFLDLVRSIESDNIRERVERIPDGRVQHFLMYRYQQDVADSTVANDCYHLRLYCGFLENRDVELEKVEGEDARAFLRQCAEYGRSVSTLEKYRVTVRQLHAHLWREFV